MITSIIFSRNRPLQLDLCIKSIKQNFKLCDTIIVIYKIDEEYREAYSALKQEHPRVSFWDQRKFLNDIYQACDYHDDEYICFFTDDCFCYKNIEIPSSDLDEILQYKEIACFSLRLGLNINTRENRGQRFTDKPMMIYDYKNYILIPKTAHPYGSYWSYSLSVDGHIFRQKDMCKMVDELIHVKDLYSWKDTPNDFESALQRFWAISPNIIAAEKTSSVVNSPNNRVQNSHEDNRFGDIFHHEPKLLLDKFMQGKRIDLSKLNIKDINCPHTELDILNGE